MKVIARNRQDLLEHLIQFEGTQDSMARVVENGDSVGDLLHCAGRL
jgi:hypothetical protein